MHLTVAALLCMTALPLILLPYFSVWQLVPIVMVAVALPLLLIGFLAFTGSSRTTGAMGLFGAAGCLVALATTTGGLLSPFLAWSVVLPLEAMILGKTRRAVWLGVAAMLMTLVSVASMTSFAPAIGASGPTGAGSFTSVLALALYGLFAVGYRRPKAEKAGATADARDTSGLYDRLPGLVTFHDERGDLRSTHGNGAAELLDHVGDLSGAGFIEQIHVSDRLQFLQAVDRLRTGHEACSVIVRLRCLDGGAGEEQFRHWSIQLAALRDSAGCFTGFMAQSRDITREIELQSSYARKVGEAEAANEAKTRFLAAVSHELRTPLNAILGFSDILTSDYCSRPLDDTQAEYVGLIRQSGQHLLDVINSMLDLSKIEAGRYELNLEPFDIREVIRDCEAMLGKQARDKKIILNTRVAKGHVRLTACRRAVQQILINLMANAIKFTGDGGIVTVDASDQNGFTRVSVSDTGIGMSEDDLQKIGAPFVQVQTHKARQYEGTGLGLSLVKGLVELHGGRFSIESKPGIGTTVSIELPLNGPHGQRSDQHPDPATNLEFPPRLAAASWKDGRGGHARAKTA